MKHFSYITTVLLATAQLVLTHGEPNLAYEHAGGIFREFHGGRNCDGGVLHDGNSSGTTQQYRGESLYVTEPKGRSSDLAILYLTDIFGNALVNNRLLADSIARAGYLVVMPDLFRGDPVPTSAMGGMEPGFNMTEWRTRHPQSQVEEIIESAITTIRTDFNASQIGAVGYCFGGKYVARFLASDRGVDVGFTAHPSSTTEEEWDAIQGPISVAFGDLDGSNTPENRTNIESIFKDGNKTYQTSLYANAEHGFAVRTNLSVSQKAFAQEAAYRQAVAWFDAWLRE